MLNMKLPYGPAIRLLSIYPTEIKSYYHMKTIKEYKVKYHTQNIHKYYPNQENTPIF